MNRRILKLNKNIQRTLMEYFIKKMKRSVLGFISVKEVFLAPDMKSAKVYLSIMSEKDQSEQMYSNLEQERYFIQKTVARTGGMKFCPRLNFFINHVSLVNSAEESNVKQVSQEAPFVG